MESFERQAVLNRAAIPVDAPRRVLVIPWGEIKSNAGDMIVDWAAADAILAAFAGHGVDLPIDYEHQTLGGKWSSPAGIAPAAAWIKSLSVEPGVGIWANVEWTERGACMVRSKEYRYMSPVALVRKGDRRVQGLSSVALTNQPAISGMRPIVNRADAAVGGRIAPGRSEIIVNAGRDYDTEPAHRRWCPSRSRFINGELYAARLAPLSDTESAEADSASIADPSRAELIANTSRAFDGDAAAQRIGTGRAAYVNGELAHARMPLLSTDEASRVAAGIAGRNG